MGPVKYFFLEHKYINLFRRIRKKLCALNNIVLVKLLKQKVVEWLAILISNFANYANRVCYTVIIYQKHSKLFTDFKII